MSSFDVNRAGQYLTHRPTLAEACGAARDAARGEPEAQITVVDPNGTIRAKYRLLRSGRLEAVIL